MEDDLLKHARVLIVDDEPSNVRYLKDVLQWAGYEHLEGVTEPRQALPTVRFFEPDLIILDLLMPEMDGFEVLAELRQELGLATEEEYLPILVLTADAGRDTRRRALAMGARDFLTKPMSPTEVRLRVGNLLETRFLYLRCRRQERRLRELEGANGTSDPGDRELLERWADIVDLRRGERAGTSRRVARLATRIARSMGADDPDVERIRSAALLHDLGLPTAEGSRHDDRSGGSGPGARDPGEADISEAVARLLGGARSPVLRTLREVVMHREERWDGRGARGVAGESIPLAARIIGVAREAVRRGTKDEVPPPDVLESLREEAGERFDPTVVDALLGPRAASVA